MAPQTQQLVQLIGYLAIFVGVLGVFLPVLPGTPLIFLGALLWAWADGFQRLGWLGLASLLALTVVAEGAKLLVSSYGARVAGASWQGIMASAIGAIVGLIVFSLPGAVIGAVGALLIVDWQRHRGDWRAAGRLTLGVLVGYVASYAVQFVLALTMVVLFLAAIRS